MSWDKLYSLVPQHLLERGTLFWGGNNSRSEVYTALGMGPLIISQVNNYIEKKGKQWERLVVSTSGQFLAASSTPSSVRAPHLLTQ